MIRDDVYNRENENDRQWLKEATRFAVIRQNLRVKDKNCIEEVCLYEMACQPYPKDKRKIAEFKYPPADALENIMLFD